MAGFNSTNEGRSSNSNSKGQHLAASNKMAYKRRRASRRVPTTILETSCQEFRDAVQKLTGFHRPAPAATTPTTAASSIMQQPKMSSSSYDDDEESYDAYDARDGCDPRGVSPRGSPQSVLDRGEASGELSDGEFFQQFLRDAARSRFPYGNNMRAPYRPAPAAPGPAGGMFGAPGGGRSLWDEIGGDFMSSMAKLQDPSLGANPYLIALENQLLAKFARRMQFAASNPLDPWYQMDQMANPMRA